MVNNVKLELKKYDNNNYYNDVLYTVFQAKKIINNPSIKFYNIIRRVVICLCICTYLIFQYFMTVRSRADNPLVLFSIVLALSVAILLYFIFLIYFKHMIKRATFVEYLIFSDDSLEDIIENNNKEKKYTFKWDMIKCIRINLHSIMILTKSHERPIIIFGINNKEDFINALTKYSKIDLVHRVCNNAS